MRPAPLLPVASGSGGPLALAVAIIVATLALSPSAWAPRAAARCQLRGRPHLEGRVAGTTAAPGGVADARLGERIDVFLVAPGLLDGQAVTFGESGARGRTSWTGAGCSAARVDWRRVEPRMRHEQTPSPNRENPLYSNAVMFGPRHGAWIGFDRIEYFESAIVPAAAAAGDGAPPVARDGGWILSMSGATPTEPIARRRAADLLPLGTMRLAAQITTADGTIATPGAEDAPDGLISERVFRLSFRRGDGFLGWVTSFFNVPYLFGSAGQGKTSQAERYVGADCADLLIAALHRAGASAVKYTSVINLVDQMHRVGAPVEVAPCAPLAPCRSSTPPLRFGSDVRAGDLLALDYIGAADLPRAWDHIVALVEDRGPGGLPDGLLGPDDLVADSGSEEGLKLAPLGEQGHVRVAVLRPR